MADKVVWRRAGSEGSFASPEETFESTGKAAEQNSAAIAEQDLQSSRINDYILHQDPYIIARRGSEATKVAASLSSMAKTLEDFEIAFARGSSTRRSTRNRSTPEGESSSHGGNIVGTTNTTFENVQTATRSFPITPLNIDNRLLKPTAYFKSLEELESEVQSSSLLGMLKVSFLSTNPHIKNFHLMSCNTRKRRNWSWMN
jgi:glycerophosphoryl diester phosphodiesterase